ncbi:MAG: 50S ribosomal protein L18 [Patescibacteria group bacterium]|nr:50S ribosomal protein L18 [Patescibacteria group bacterium]
MDKNRKKNINRAVRRARIRSRVAGTKKRPRLSVFRSNRGMYVQLIDDEAGKTLASAHSKEAAKNKGGDSKKDVSFELGKLIAKKAADKKIKQVVFDRGGYKYHGRVKTLAEGAKEGGLKF